MRNLDDRNYELRNDIFRVVDQIEETEHLLRIRRLARWCIAKEI